MSYADSDKGAASLKGNLRKAELVSKRVDWFGKTTFSFLKNSDKEYELKLALDDVTEKVISIKKYKQKKKR